jgi:hypothetical protein
MGLQWLRPRSSLYISAQLVGQFPKMIRWEEIDHVSYTRRRDGTVSGLQIDAGTRRIEIGSLGVRDLGTALSVILSHAPKGIARFPQISDEE